MSASDRGCVKTQNRIFGCAFFAQNERRGFDSGPLEVSKSVRLCVEGASLLTDLRFHTVWTHSGPLGFPGIGQRQQGDRHQSVVQTAPE